MRPVLIIFSLKESQAEGCMPRSDQKQKYTSLQYICVTCLPPQQKMPENKNERLERRRKTGQCPFFIFFSEKKMNYCTLLVLTCLTHLVISPIGRDASWVSVNTGFREGGKHHLAEIYPYGRGFRTSIKKIPPNQVASTGSE